ncbi:hypothetical protein ANAEL_00077 [Anaerolineales bacterium]|nr:hypothetical protein ANAEL_00077 [Anaerolineales bacterium]
MDGLRKLLLEMKKYLSTIILASILLAGLLTFNQYGESWDDRSLQKYAAKSINAYITFPQQGKVNITPEDLGYYGPAYVMAVDLLSRALDFLPFPLPDLRHLVYFLTYFAGILAFHSLAKRWLSDLPALGATILYATQPLLWGHAFINPKDTPFLSLFLISLALGFNYFDKLPVESGPRPKRIQLLLTALWVGSVFSLFIFTESFYNLISNLIHSAHDGNANIFSLIASDILTAKPEIYIQKYFILFLRARATYYLLFTIYLLYLYRQRLPSALLILPSAFLLGFTTSTRILGPFAGILVAYYALRTKGKRAISSLIAYAILSLIFTYLTWPYLWMNPIGQFIESFKEMSLYPWTGVVLFNGANYQLTNLPTSYLPLLLAIQLTEPIWALSLTGWLVSIFGANNKRGLVELSVLWFVLPLTAFIVMRTALYDNFRQILFILPPIFLMAGVAFEAVKQVKWQAVLIGLCLVPNLLGIVALHPYEYIYYNRFIGGVDGAAGRFELDYWGISYREAAEYVNQVAPPNSTIWLEGPAALFQLYSREDLKTYSTNEAERADYYDYVVATTRYNLDETAYPGAEVIYEIKRGNAVLTVIKKP